MRVAELAQGLADLEHRGVGRQDVEGLAWRCSFQGLHYRLPEVGDYRANGEVRVLEAHGHVLGSGAGDHEGRGALGAGLDSSLGGHLEVHVPEPRDVAAVGVVVVYGYEDVEGLDARDEGAQDLVEANGVLYEEQERLPV